MKIKKQLVLFITLLIYTSTMSVEKTSEESFLISKYLSKNKQTPKQFEIPLGSKAYDLDMIIFRDIEGPPVSVSREFKVKAIMNKMDFQFILNNAKKFTQQRVWWNDFTFIDGKAVFRYEDMNYFISDPFKKIMARFIKRMSAQINIKSLAYFRESCVFSLRGRYMGSKKSYKDLDGKNFKKDPYQMYVFCFPEDPKGLMVTEFTKKFESFYTHYMINIVDNLIDLQTFRHDDPKKFKYFTSDFDYIDNKKDNNDFLTGWGRVNENGVLFTSKKVSL